MNDIRKNQIKRILEKEKRKRKARFRMIVGVALVSLSIPLTYFSVIREDNAQADTAKLLVSSEENDKAPGTNLSENVYQDVKVSYKRVLVDTDVYQEVSTNPKTIYKLKKGDYVEFYGQENTWAKVSNFNQIGYIQAEKFENLKSDELVVKNGLLMDSKKTIFPEDFTAAFDKNTENAMMVMFEAMRREGLRIGVSRKSLENEEIIQDSSQEYEIPNYSNHTLRTGSSIELEIPEVSQGLDFGQTTQGRWLRDNAHKYGFILRYPAGKEPITGFYANDRIFRYVGVKAAKDIFENNITFEEYFGL